MGFEKLFIIDGKTTIVRSLWIRLCLTSTGSLGRATYVHVQIQIEVIARSKRRASHLRLSSNGVIDIIEQLFIQLNVRIFHVLFMKLMI